MIASTGLGEKLAIGPRSIVAGLVGSAGLLGAYLALISLAQGPDHALAQLALDAPFVLAIAAGFGAQIALFAELRAIDRRHRAAAAVTATGTGTGAAAMLACCAHHLVELLPLLGLSAAAAFLTAYQAPLFVVAIAMNLVGIAVMARQLVRTRRAGAQRHGRGAGDHARPLDGPASRAGSTASLPAISSGRQARSPMHRRA